MAQIGVGLPGQYPGQYPPGVGYPAAGIPVAAAIRTAVDRATRLPAAAPEEIPIKSQRHPSPVVIAA